MGYQRHSEEFKKAAVQKFLLRGSRSVELISQEMGVSSPSLYEWRKRYATGLGMKKSERRPQDWSASEKFDAVMEFDRLDEQNQGEFLRREGLHSDHIAAWKKLMREGLETASKATPAARAERAEDKRKIKELERDLHRKDRALAETTALLVLKKKADLIWGTGENE